MEGNSLYDTVDLRRLACFAAVAEELSFSRASRRLSIAQPWVSAQVRHLEESLGVPLLVRTTRRVELTLAGEALLAPTQKLLSEVARLAATIEQVRRGIAQTLRLGAPAYTYSLSARQELLRQYAERYPEVDLDIQSGFATHLLARLRAGELDAVVCPTPFDDTGLSSSPISFDSFAVAIPEDHPNALLSPLRVEDFRGSTFVTWRKHNNPLLFELYYGILREVDVTLVSVPEVSDQAIQVLADKIGGFFLGLRGTATEDLLAPRRRILRYIDDAPEKWGLELNLVLEPTVASLPANRLWQLARSLSCGPGPVALRETEQLDRRATADGH